MPCLFAGHSSLSLERVEVCSLLCSELFLGDEKETFELRLPIRTLLRLDCNPLEGEGDPTENKKVSCNLSLQLFVTFVPHQDTGVGVLLIGEHKLIGENKSGAEACDGVIVHEFNCSGSCRNFDSYLLFEACDDVSVNVLD
jgi:hypothetical protein